MVRRVVQGSAEAVAAVLARTGTGTGVNTASSERLNATFRARLTPWVRRGRALLHEESPLQAGMYLVGCAYNFCWVHDSLRQAAPAGTGRKWQERTPAMAAGLTDHCGELGDVMAERVMPERWKAPRVRPRRRRRPQAAVQAIPA